MELVEGLVLLEYCEFWEFGFEDWFEFFNDVCLVVVYVYWNLVVYCDFKFLNIFVFDEGCVCLFDFGIVKLLEFSDFFEDVLVICMGIFLMMFEYVVLE